MVFCAEHKKPEANAHEQVANVEKREPNAQGEFQNVDEYSQNQKQHAQQEILASFISEF